MLLGRTVNNVQATRHELTEKISMSSEDLKHCERQIAKRITDTRVSRANDKKRMEYIGIIVC